MKQFQRIRRALSILLTAAMLLSLPGLSAFALAEDTDVGTADETEIALSDFAQASGQLTYEAATEGEGYTFTTTTYGKWNSVPVVALQDYDWSTGTFTLTYVDNGVGEDKATNSDFGVFLRFTGTGSAQDEFLYIGYSTQDAAVANDVTGNGWFWQYRYDGRGEFLSMPIQSGEGVPAPVIGEETTLAVEITEEGAINLTVTTGATESQATLTLPGDRKDWDVTGMNGNGSLTGLLPNLEAGSVGFGALAAGSSVNTNITVKSASVTGGTAVTPDSILAAAKTEVEGAEYTAASSDASDAAAAKTAAEGKLSALGLNTGITFQVNDVEGGFTAAVDGTKEQPAGTAGSYKFTVTLSMDGASPVTTTELTMTITPAAYVEPEPEELADPGLPPVEMAEGDDDYNQDLTQSTSITGGQAVNINQEVWGMDGRALVLTTSGDTRVKFTDIPAIQNGAYEITFRTGDALPTSLGFLPRYLDESNYIGFSIDGVGSNWQIHYSNGSGRQNIPVTPQPEALQPNATYKMKLTFNDTTVKVEYMKEGDAAYTEITTYTLNSSGYTGADGGFAIRQYGGAPVTLDNIIQYGADGQVAYTMDFNAGELPAFSAQSNKGAMGSANGSTSVAFTEVPASETAAGFAPGRGTKIAAEAAGVYVDSTAPSAANPTYTVQLNGSSNKLGLVFNYQDADNYAAVWYDGAKWVAGGRSGGQDVAAIDLSAQNIPAPDGTRTYRIAYDEAKGYTLTVSAGAVEDATAEDARSYELGRLDGIFTGKGKVGLYVGEAMTLYAGPIQVVYELLPTVLPEPGEDSYITLKSDEMQVLVGSEFPYVYTYKDLAGTVLAYGTLVGSEDSRIYVDTAENLYDATENTNNFVLCNTTSRLVTSSDTSATYEIVATDEANNINATFTVVLTVSGKTLKMEIPSVVEADGSAAVRAFQFGNNPVLTLAGLGVGAAMGVHSGWGPMKDDFITLKGASQNATYSSFTYGMFYDTASGVSASVENNAENGNSKYILTQNVSETPYLSLNSASWAWQYYDEIDPEDEEKPYISVVIGGDENADGAITWQDAGVAYRDIMRLPYGYENTKNEWMFIAMNMSSQASQPFLRVLDQAKALSYLTDGFGMKIMNKGYQVSGHDDSHGDYDFSGLQQGGTDGFNTLIDVGLEYGIKNGVHANATEFALDGFDTVLANMRGVVTGGELQDNWNWFDQAYLVDKNKDVWSGALKERIQEFDDALPNLDFVYLDVYQAGTRYKATQLVKYFNEVGITMGTEALQDLNQMITFVHWNTDMYYATGGTQSEVMKFVSHGVGDLAAPDKGILGSLLPGIADWRNYNMFSDGVDVFYRNNLPTKYLQHFELLSWEPSQKAVFSDNVVSTVEGDITTITKDGKVIAKIDTSTILNYADYSGQTPKSPKSAEIFIPWSPEVEDKIYAYSDSGNFGTWDVPNSWSGVETAYLYQLTTTGRVLVEEVTVTDGKVTLNLESGVPYILTKEAETVAHRYDVDGSVMTDENGVVYLPTLEEHPYGEGTLFEDPGFTSLSIDPWTVTGNAEAAEVVEWEYEQPVLQLDPVFEGSVGQTVSVEPGKTYSISVWVNSAGDRPVTLTVIAGDAVESNSIDTTADHTVNMKPSKFTGKNFQRLNVDITIPNGVEEAVVALSTVAGTNTILADDFRSWAWTDLTGAENPAPAAEAEEYYYYEDFEHTDEGWGPFVSNVNNQPFVNLAYYDFGGDQIKTYVIGASETNRTSLKGQQTGSFGTEGDGTPYIIMRTEPATLNFETGYKYTVEFDYETYFEFYQSGPNGVTVANCPPGKNAPLNADTYFLIDVRKSDGTIIETYKLEPNEFDPEYVAKYIEADGSELNTDPESYNVHPATKTLSFEVDATTEKDIYLTFRLSSTANLEGHPVFAIDNFRVTQTAPESLADALAAVENASYTTTQTKVSTAEAAKAEAEAIVDALNLGEGVTAVVNDGGVFFPATTGTAGNPDGVNGAYAFTVTLTSGGDTVTTEMLSLVIAATSYENSPGYIPPENIGDKDDGETEEPGLPFTDVPDGIWYEEAVRFVYDNGIMQGTAEGRFTPYGVTTRGTIVTMLYRLEGEPAVTGSDFADVADGQFYSNAVAWASANGIVSGYGNGSFGPSDNVTREQMAVILHNYAVFKGYDVSASGDLSVFTDSGAISSWAQESMAWAVGSGLMSGKGSGVLDPSGTATRAELAQMFMNFCGQN